MTIPSFDEFQKNVLTREEVNKITSLADALTTDADFKDPEELFMAAGITSMMAATEILRLYHAWISSILEEQS